MSMKTEKIIRLTLTYFVILIVSAVILYPIIWIVGSSLNPGNSLSSSQVIPDNATLTHYKSLFNLEESQYLIWYMNTLIICFSTMIITVIMIALMAYSFSRYRFVGRKYGLMTFLILQMIPNFAALIAIYILAVVTGLIDTHILLILIYVGGLLPMNTWLAKGYFETIPHDLDDSAKIDGAGHFRIFWSIILPLVKPILAVIALFAFITPFTDFILARILLRSPENYTLAVGLYDMVANNYGAEFTKFAAGAVLIAIPIGLVFLSLQRYLISGLTSGGTKG
ncbi:arabinogalactan oligomer/maltooligosaccharide transport system permease protein [Alkalibacillus filiformis]|uniref:Arabinogalactan oligomer/maltooligosaccharide transport system permease protein n=1 Tax=Alkalibacillus filiformis TaxID=200990 RepID=A0ABU0DUY8_9BACI|nr:sugar ABC transporter permease [Alkalibacillus filiformis]MDQ0352175.1 arabinogalactan oligomer/maltooligosaccharide transport system permease protein [Alkalibacillus filiformis]